VSQNVLVLRDTLSWRKEVKQMLTNLYLRILALRDEEKGAAMAEYGILVAGIAVVVLLTVWALGGEIQGAFQSVVDQIAGP
jgi:Flp pilus assembly pilin Flp